MKNQEPDRLPCPNCGEWRMTPPIGLFGTNDVACEFCEKCYDVIEHNPILQTWLEQEAAAQQNLVRKILDDYNRFQNKDTAYAIAHLVMLKTRTAIAEDLVKKAEMLGKKNT